MPADVMNQMPSCLDGLRAELLESPVDDLIQLYVTAKGQGVQVVEPIAVTQFPLTREGRAKARLFLPLIQAFCRFVNAGGDVEDLPTHMGPFAHILKTIEYGPSEEWAPLTTVQDVPQPIHIFSSTEPDSDMCLLFIEDIMVDVLPLEALSDMVYQT